MIWLVPLKIASNVSRFKPALNLNRVLADLNRGSNSLNSISVTVKLSDLSKIQQIFEDLNLQKYTKHMEFHFMSLCITLNYTN